VKRLPPEETPLGMLFWFGIFAVLGSAAPAVLVWQWPSLEELALLVFVGVLGVLSQSFWIRAFRAGEASLVAPVDYLRLLFAGLVGFFAFAELPGTWTLAGAAIIVLSTLYILRREVRLGRTPHPAEMPR
jgi:drug/metabolite transporter (DMT)-like permease